MLGAWAGGVYRCFADNASLLIGPVFFLDQNLPPGGTKYMRTAQLDIDLLLAR